MRKDLLIYILKKMQSLAIPLEKINIQKMIFFLRETGLPVNYKYEPYLFGPYSTELKFDLMDLELWGHIVSNEDSEYIYNSSETNIESIIDKSIQAKIDHKIGQYTSAINNSYTFDNMEVSGTVVYCIRALEKLGLKTDKNSVLKEFKNWKGNKYPDATIGKMYDRIYPILN